MAANFGLPLPELDYSSALRRVLSLADYERMAGLAPPIHKPDLGRMVEFAQRLGDPQRCAPVVHVAGTKGKGSVAAMVASILVAAGKRTGLFTSPHLHSFTERIQLNGAPISQEAFALHLGRVWLQVEAMGLQSPYGKPSTFEVLTAMAFDYFQAEKVDVQVLEVGLGGRLDSTNVADGRVAVITSLSLDHTAILGDRIELIAAEKAGIIKPNAQVVLSPQEPEARKVVAGVCRRQGARLCELGHDVVWQGGRSDLTGQELSVQTSSRTYKLWLPLLGAHQRQNAAAAIAAVEAMDLGVTEEAVVRGIRDVKWPGRFQVLSSAPFVVVDGAHNPHSAGRLRETVLEQVRPRRTWLVFGCSADKDLAGIVAELAPITHHAFVCTSRHPRAVPAQRLSELFQGAGVEAEAAGDVAGALADAQARADRGDLVLVTGSLFVVAEALEAWFGIEPERYPELEPPSLAPPGAPAQRG
jgi:dihydrofolate synthase/folylpolyglutamate synthase